jgi:carbonic anhydrase
MERRSVLKGLAAASLCPICLAEARADGGHEPHWTYEGHGGPEQWGELSPEFKVCGLGVEQSPIDLTKPIQAKLSDIALDWKPFLLQVGHNGHTIRSKVPAGSSLTLNGEKYTMVNFHFHHPSEHALDGKLLEMELHFVHLNEKKTAAVALGVFIVPGAENPALKPIWATMPKTANEIQTDIMFDPNTLLPASRERYTYEGSLTTPGCDEFVHWQVLRTPITASPEQIKTFADIFPNNSRPVQKLNRRYLLGNF